MSDEICRNRILSEEYRDFIIPVDGGNELFRLPEVQRCVQGNAGGYEIAYVERSQAEPLNFVKFTYQSIPHCYSLLDMGALNQTGISQVQSYPTLQLMGENVMIGFVDTGIDYRNQVFRKLDGSTRIVSIWDQSVQTGVPPEAFAYGSEYTEELINEALRSDAPLESVPTEDSIGHGTFMASLAAGGGNPEQNFLGAAPEAQIAVVKLKQPKRYLRDYYLIPEESICFQENDIMLGIQYLFALAERRGLPLVVCIALGTNFGGHNGATPLSVLLEQYSYLPNRALVTGVGNEANRSHHYMGKINSMQSNDEVEIRVGDESVGFTMEIWTDIPNLITIAILSPSGEQIPRISIKQGQQEVFRFLFEGTEVYVEYRILASRSNSQVIFLRFDRPTEGIWKIIVEPIRLADGVFHMWLPLQEMISGEVVFLEPEPNTTLVSPAAANGPMTVAFYNGTENGVDINSGRGYTRNGRIKPDLAAPGVAVTGALPGNRFAVRTGSSIAVGIAAGAAALLLEWLYYHIAERADSVQVKNLFILGAQKRQDMEYPNREWGYGTLNLYEVLQQIRQI